MKQNRTAAGQRLYRLCLIWCWHSAGSTDSLVDGHHMLRSISPPKCKNLGCAGISKAAPEYTSTTWPRDVKPYDDKEALKHHGC